VRRTDSRLWPYLLLALACFIGLGVHTWNRQWSSDYWVHEAAVETLRHEFGDPPEELTKSDAASPSYTPYTVALAGVGRLTGWSSVTVLQLAAMANLVVLLAGFEVFVSALTGRRRVAFWALLATLFLWGIDPWRWSGFFSLNSIGFGLPYPSTLATGVAFFVGWALLRYAEQGSIPWLGVVVPGFVFVALVHPFTAVWTAIVLAAIAVHWRLYRRERIVPLAFGALAAGVLVAVWPYYSLFELVGAGEGYVQWALYHRLPARVLAALPGFYVVVRRFLRDTTDPLALMLIGGIAVYAYGAIVDDTNFGRVLPLVMFTAHVGIGILVADWIEARVPPNRVLLAWLAISVVIGVAGVLPGLLRTVPRALLPASTRERQSLQPITEPYDELDGALPFGTIIAAETDTLQTVAPAYGPGVFAPSRPTPFVDDVPARQATNRRLLALDTPEAERRALANRYDVEAVLCATEQCRDVFADGNVVTAGDGWTLIRLPR
jgi:hypothetical protein